MARTAATTIHEIVKHMGQSSGFNRVLSKVHVVTADKTRCTVELKVEEEHTNEYKTLHGGLIATLVDNVTTWALMSAGGHPGVSVNLNVSYLRPAKIGETILVVARVLKFGKSLAFLAADVLKKDDNSLLAQASHTKALPKS